MLAPPAPNLYVRVSKRPDGVVQIRTGVRRFRREDGTEVTLVGAMHIGTAGYYDALQRELDDHEVVLYEGVRPSKNAPKPVKKATPIYRVLSDALGLTFQMERVKYDRPQWENADITWDELAALGRKAGPGSRVGSIQNILTPGSAGAEALTATLSTATPGTREALKLLMLKVASGIGVSALGKETTSVLLDARNVAAMSALRRRLNAPDRPRSVAVFYGAAHLPGMETILRRDLGFRPDPPTYLIAATADPSRLDSQGKQMLAMFDAMMDLPPIPRER